MTLLARFTVSPRFDSFCDGSLRPHGMPLATEFFVESISEMILTDILSPNRKFLGVLLLLSAAPILFTTTGLYWISQNYSLIDTRSFNSLVIFSLASVPLIALALAPSTVVAILAGHTFGGFGLLAILISYPLACLLGLVVGQLLLSLLNIAPLIQSNKNIAPILAKMATRELSLVAYLRLSPALPFAMINVLLASLQPKLYNYIVGSMLGMLPRTLLFFWVGMNAKNVWEFARNPTLEGSWRIIPVVLVVVSLVGVVSIVRRALKLEEFGAAR